METKLVNDLTYTTRNTRGSPVLFERGLTHTSLLLCLPASALRDDLSPEDPNLSSNFHAQASEETGPKKGPIWRGLLRRSEQKHVCSLASRRPPSSLTKPQGQKGSQRPGQPPEPAPSCLCVTDPPGQPTLPQAPAHWRKPLLPEPAGEEPTDTTSCHHPGLQARGGQGPATT